jgi:hypothetical protein
MLAGNEEMVRVRVTGD